MTLEEPGLERLERLALQEPDEIDYARLGWLTYQTVGKVPRWDSEGRIIPPTRDEVEICRRWRDQPFAGAAIALGLSKLLGIDVDAHRGGIETAKLILDGDMPPHPVCSTPRGGRHLIFRSPVTCEIEPKTDGLGPGIDVLAGAAGRCTIPPTPGYFWIVSPLESPAPYAPLWLWKRLPKVTERAAQRSPSGRKIRFAINDVLPRLTRTRPRRSKGGGWTASCPAHDDRHPSFWIREGDDGQPYVGCSVCTDSELLAAVERLVGVKGAA